MNVNTSRDDYAPTLRIDFERRAGISGEDLRDPESPNVGMCADVVAMQEWFKAHWQEDFDITMTEYPDGTLQAFPWRRTSRGWAVSCESGWELVDLAGAPSKQR